MGCEDDGCSHEWHYAPYRTGLGALQRGRSAAAAWLQDRPDQGHLVYTTGFCVTGGQAVR